MNFWQWIKENAKEIEFAFVWRFAFLLAAITLLSVIIAFSVEYSIWFLIGVPPSILVILYAFY